MKKILRITGFILTAVTIILIIVIICTGFFANNMNSTGIIGGADSPTAIFIASQFKWILLPLIAGICCIIISAFIKKK